MEDGALVVFYVYYSLMFARFSLQYVYQSMHLNVNKLSELLFLSFIVQQIYFVS